MSKGTLDDAGTPTREDMLAPAEPLVDDDEDVPIAEAPLPGYGTE